MVKNEGSIDRAVRAVAAVALVIVAAAVGFGTVGGVIALVVAVVLGVTAAVGMCPIYRVLHMSTLRRS